MVSRRWTSQFLNWSEDVGFDCAKFAEQTCAKIRSSDGDGGSPVSGWEICTTNFDALVTIAGARISHICGRC